MPVLAALLVVVCLELRAVLLTVTAQGGLEPKAGCLPGAK